MRYRITSCRFDESPRTYKEFNAESDEAAKAVFEKEARKESNAWDAMFLYRLDQVEITTLLISARVS